MKDKRKSITIMSIILIIVMALVIWFVSGLTSNHTFQRTGSPITEEELSYRQVFSLTSNSFQYENVDHMGQMADLIIVGTPTENFKDRQHIMTFYKDGSMQDFYTLTELSIDAIFKKPDDFPKDQHTISIIEPVSLDGETKYTDNSYVELQKGDQSVIFLGKNTFGNFGIINNNLGKYSLDHPEVSISRMTEEANRQSDADQSDKYIKYREEIFEKYNLK